MISLMPPMPALRVDRRAIEHLRERRKCFDTRRVREEGELTVVRPPVQALVALSALRRACDEDPIANLYALDHCANGLDDAEAAMVRNLGAADRVGGERAAHDCVAGRDGGRADDDLSRIDRQQSHLLNVYCAVVAHESAERASGLRVGQHGRSLRCLCADLLHASQQSRAAAERGRSCFQNTPPCHGPFPV
jgi:hypothetical protein